MNKPSEPNVTSGDYKEPNVTFGRANGSEHE
jgi:hypothetical protein